MEPMWMGEKSVGDMVDGRVVGWVWHEREELIGVDGRSGEGAWKDERLYILLWAL